MPIFILATFLALGAVPSLCAQRIAASPFPSISDATATDRPGVTEEQRSDQVGAGWLIGGGLLAGARGRCRGDVHGRDAHGERLRDCAIIGAAYGLVAGVSSGMQIVSAIAIERNTGRERYQRPI